MSVLAGAKSTEQLQKRLKRAEELLSYALVMLDDQGDSHIVVSQIEGFLEASKSLAASSMVQQELKEEDIFA